MTNETLMALIDRANGQPGDQVLFIRPLTETVHLAKAWLRAPTLQQTTTFEQEYSLYLIRSATQGYVGIVLDMGEADLHWLVLPAQRGKYHLSTALREVILPHLLQDRAAQRITISRNFGEDAYQASERVALAVGFSRIDLGEDEQEYTTTLEYAPEQSDIRPTIQGQSRALSYERVTQLQQELAYHATCLQVISMEVAMHLGEQNVTEQLADLALDVLGMGNAIEDTNWVPIRREQRIQQFQKVIGVPKYDSAIRAVLTEATHTDIKSIAIDESKERTSRLETREDGWYIYIVARQNPEHDQMLLFALLHELGHYHDPQVLPKDKQGDQQLRLAREERAWAWADRELKKYPELEEDLELYERYKKSCLATYQQGC